MSRKLTEKQKFLDVLFEEANGNLSYARTLAGYSNTYTVASIVGGLKDEIIEATKTYMAQNAPAAAVAVVSGFTDPTQLGIKDKLNAAKDLLDRSGLIKAEKIQVHSTGGVMILPPKDNYNDDEDY